MAELRGVHQRLEAALGRLDSAVDSHLNSAASKEKIDQLARDLDLAHAENAKLQDATGEVAQRLDAAIDRIRKILDGSG